MTETYELVWLGKLLEHPAIAAVDVHQCGFRLHSI